MYLESDTDDDYGYGYGDDGGSNIDNDGNDNDICNTCNEWQQRWRPIPKSSFVVVTLNRFLV